jgi:hypothetical protein
MRGLFGQYQDAVAKEYRLLDIVGDEYDGSHPPAPNVEDFALHPLARRLIEAHERLVHENKVRIGGERPRNCDALLHPAGDLVRVIRFEARQPDDVDDFANLGRHIRRRCAFDAQTSRDVIEHR